MLPKKSLGQHWLNDESMLEYISEAGDIKPKDIVLEVGPGPGALTKYLAKKAGKVIAVELDQGLAIDLVKRVPSSNLKVEQGDILRYDLSKLPKGYKVVANIPYYLTSNLLRVLSESENPPTKMVLLVQREVAERIAAVPGQMSVLAVSVQLYYEPKLGKVVPAAMFTPTPKVDSQVIILDRRAEPLFPDLDRKVFFRIVKAGFSEKRKKLRSSLSGGLAISKQQADEMLAAADISNDLRAESLSLQQWYKLYLQLQLKNNLRSLL